ncbi:MAG: DNRLRE domain-containing protein [Planctomycetota bacterium]
MRTARTIFLLLSAWAISAALSGPLQAEEKTVELVLSKDPKSPGQIIAWRSNLPTTGYRSGEGRGVVGWEAGNSRLWLQWDLASIPKNAFVVSAVIRLWQNDRSGRPFGHVFDLCTVLKHVDAQHCCWNGPVENISWTQGGCDQSLGPTADRSLPVASETITPHPHVWRQWDVTDAVQSIVSNGVNNGFVLFDRYLRENDPNRNAVVFAMPDDSVAEHRPVLVLRYSDKPVPRTNANSLLLPPPKIEVVKTRQAYRDGETPLPEYHMTKMATLVEAEPWGNFSATLDRGVIRAGAKTTTGEIRVLMKFGQLLPTPSPATEVRVIVHAKASPANANLQLRRVTQDWNIAEVSWNERRWGQAWSTPGGSAQEIHMPCEIQDEPDGEQLLAFDVTDWFHDWQIHPDHNDGVMFVMPDGPATADSTALATDRADPTGLRPQLEVLCGLKAQ